MQATSPAPPRRPGVSPGRLRRVLYAIGLNPSLKYGSLEEQVFSLARAFQEQGSLFLPLFQCGPGSEALAMYHRAGLEVSWLDLGTFDFATLGRLMRIIREHRIDVVSWQICRPGKLYF